MGSGIEPGKASSQKFYPEIHRGEVSLVYFCGKFSHAILKSPKDGEIRVQEEYGGKIEPHNPTDYEFKIAKETLKNISHDWLYARVDILPELGLMELECIEPALYFGTSKIGAKRMAHSILKLPTIAL